MRDNNDSLAIEMASLSKNQNESEKDGILKTSLNPNVTQSSCSSLWVLLTSYVTYTWQYAPKICWTLSILAILFPSYLIVVDVFFNPTDNFGFISNDYTNINLQSNFDLKMKDIDHWCLKGNNDSCRCEDPTYPAPRNEFRSWSNAHAGNVQLITDMIEQGISSPEIAFLGGSVVEKMDGRWFGDVTLAGLDTVANIFSKHFSGTEGGMTAAALGVAADQNQAVLYRILNGEMPDGFNPKIWWLELGLNDLGRAQCSEEVVIIGVLRIVEEIRKLKPDAKIVINSLFPMAELRGGLSPPTPVDLERSFGNRPKGGWKDRKRDRPSPANKNRSRPGGRPVAENGGPNKPRIQNYRPRTFNENRSNYPNSVNRPSNYPNSVNRPRDNNGYQRNLRQPPDDRGGFRNKRSRDDFVKLYSDRKSQHEFSPITHKTNKLPLWTSINAINRELRKFCDKNENVSFFDVTNIFTERDGWNYNLKTSMISRMGLPTNAGFEAWENAVAIRARQLLL